MTWFLGVLSLSLSLSFYVTLIRPAGPRRRTHTRNPYFSGGVERWITDFRAKLEWMRATPGIRVRTPVMKAW